MIFLITGAGRGLGIEFSRQLLAKKHNVIAWVRDIKKATELQDLQKQYGPLLKIQQVDITHRPSCLAAAAEIKAVDVVVNNAGVFLDAQADLPTLSAESIEETFSVNVIAPMLVTQTLLPVLQKSPTALLANISSLMGSIDDNGSGGCYAYRMSKSALNMFTKSFSVDYPEIKTLALHPGWVQTELGGDSAPVLPKDSVAGLLQVILESGKYKTASFIDFRGKQLPW